MEPFTNRHLPRGVMIIHEDRDVLVVNKPAGLLTMGTEKDVVIGIDSSTTATKAIAWNRDGSVAGVGRSPIALSSPGNNRYEQDPEDWWAAAAGALRELLGQVAPERVAALAASRSFTWSSESGTSSISARPPVGAQVARSLHAGDEYHCAVCATD